MDSSHSQPKSAASSSDSMSSSPDPADGLAPLPTVRRGKKRYGACANVLSFSSNMGLQNPGNVSPDGHIFTREATTS